MKSTNNHVCMLVWNSFQNDARVKNEAKTLVYAGYKVTVLALHFPDKTAKREIVGSGIEVRRFVHRAIMKQPRSKVSFSQTNLLLSVCSRLTTHFAMLWHIIKTQPSIVHAHDVNTLPTAWLAARIIRAPLIYDAHEISTNREGYKAFRNIVGWLEKNIMPETAGNITTTDIRAKFFARMYHISRPLVLQNRPRLSVPETSNRIREELRLMNSEWPVVLYQGGFQPGRGLLRLVEVAQQVPNAYFVFIGGGRLMSELNELAYTLELTERVRFIDTVPLVELPSYTASADIGVQPIENTCLNHFSTDSNKLFEYMMAGLPVVATNLPEVRKIVRNYNFGLLVSPGDTEELAEAIRQLANDTKLRKTYGENATKAAKQINWEEQEGKLLSLYNGILDIHK